MAAVQGSTNENLAPAAINSLTKELANLCKEPEEGITVILNEENVADIVAEIDGPGAHSLTSERVYHVEWERAFRIDVPPMQRCWS